MHTALNADWAKNPGRTALQTIHQVYTTATGSRVRFSDSCNHCILTLLRECGRVYFRDKEEIEKAKAEEPVQPAKEVAVSDAPAKVVRKKKVTTKKK